MSAGNSQLLTALRASEIELEYVRCHCRDARGTDVIEALKLVRNEIAKIEQGEALEVVGESRAISVAGGSPDESLTVPTQIAGREATQREVVSGEPA